MTIQSAEATAFFDEDITVLQTMADQLANAIENARLLKDTRSRLARLTALQETSSAVVSTLELNKLLNLITQQATTLLQGDGGIINLVDWEKREDEVVTASGSCAHTIGFRSLLKDSLSGWVTLHNQPVISNQLQNDDRVDVYVRSGKIQNQSAAIAPLAIKGQVIGTLVVMDKRGGKGEFDQADLDLLIAFANQAATAIENARLFEAAQHELAERKRAETKLERRAVQLQAAAEVSRATTSILNPEELMGHVVDLVRERFDLYYVGLFLLDEERKFAVLRAGTGEAGRKMLEAGHKLEVGGESMIGWCLANAQVRIALDVGEEAVRFSNPLLPETRSEMALPLVSRGQAIGAMTIQSAEAAAFFDEDITVLQTMASQLANAIENVRLIERTQAALAELEATHQLYVREKWAEVLAARAVRHYERTRPDVAPLGDGVLAEVERAMVQQEVVVQSSAGDGAKQAALVAPINLRGTVIGALGLHETEGERQWTSDEIALIEAVADQMALALENARLFEETQRRAARERLIREITARIRDSVDVESILQTTVREVGKALGTSHGLVRLGTEVELLSGEDKQRA